MRQLLIFLKYPTPGKVKTRLAQALGARAACEAYRMCVETTLDRLHTFHRETRLWIDPPSAIAQTRRWLGRRWAYRPQQGRDLGHRLRHAVAGAFAEGAQRVVVIGTDSPWLDRGTIHQAFTALRGHDLVLGPSRDGGYYLIGVATLAPAIFSGIGWSTPRVLSQTLSKAKRLGLSVHRLPVGYDVDHVDDWQQFLNEGGQAR